MCGIVGITEDNGPLVEKAAATIAHRGPDDQGFWSNHLLSLGFDRLAIQDLNPRANQPMWDDVQELCIIFNGEIYNFKELKAELEKEFSFRTTSDTEVLLYAYKKWGALFAERLIGMYAIALYDKRSERLLLYRDHVGIKPLIYYCKDGLLLFASEMKGLMRALGLKKIKPNIDQNALRQYFALGYITSPATLYQEIRKVPRGSCLEFDLKEKKIVSIQHIEYKEKAVSMKKEDVFLLVEQSILEHLISDVPVGVFFSGGTDSSLIASVLHTHGVNLETFSVAVEGRNEDEKYFAEISEHLALQAHRYPFTSTDFGTIYESVTKAMDEPLCDASIFPTTFISQKARQKVTVVLSGEGGDELFFGYPRQRGLAGMRRSHDKKLTVLDRLFLQTPSFKGKSKIFEKIFSFSGQPASYYLLAMAPGRDRTSPASWIEGKEALWAATNDPLYFDRDVYLENDLLRKTDLATSACSLEGRVPLLDPRIIANASQFEAEYSSNIIDKPILKQMLEKFLPNKFVYRKKSGFGVPLTTYLNTSSTFRDDVEKAITFLEKNNLLFVRLPPTREELFTRYSTLCFALVSLYYSMTNNAKLLGTESL